MTYTVTASLPTGGVAKTFARTRDEADEIFDVYLRDYPQAEVVLRDGENVLVSAGPPRGPKP